MADIPIPSAGQMGVFAMLPVGQQLPALMSEGASESPERHLESAQNKLHLGEIGAVVNLRANQAGLYVLDATDFAREMLRSHLTERVDCGTSPKKVNDLEQSALPRTSLRKSTEVERRFSELTAFHA